MKTNLNLFLRPQVKLKQTQKILISESKLDFEALRDITNISEARFKSKKPLY